MKYPLVVDKYASFLKRLFTSQADFDTDLLNLIEYGRESAPTAAWHLLQSIDFKADMEKFTGWLSENTPGGEDRSFIQAYYFGLSDNGVSVHLDGTADYEAEDEAFEWAAARIYESDESWVDSQALATFATISSHLQNSDPNLQYVMCLGYAGLLVRKLAPAILWTSPLARKPLAVGFDIGDAYLVFSALIVN